MIEIIRIKNVALIEEVEVSFTNGLNILSGETGAGKSIIIDSITFLLGKKPSSTDFIRTGKESALVEGIFTINNIEVLNYINELGIEIGDDNLIVIQRSFNDQGKTTSRINGRVVSISTLAEISKLLIDVHGQHEHQSLLNPSKHIDILDRFCNEELFDLKDTLASINREYKNIAKTIDTLIQDERDRANKIDLYSFQIDEISKAILKENEEDELLDRKKLLLGSEKLSVNVKKSIELLNGSSDEKSALDMISETLRMVGEVVSLDSSKKSIYDSLFNIEAELEEISRDLRNYDDELYFDENELNEIEERLNTIYHLKRKYGNSVSEILDYYNDIMKKFDLINNSTQELEKLENKKSKLYDEAILVCNSISEIRKRKATELEALIQNHLRDLGMVDAEFNIQITTTDSFNSNGNDRVEFLISPNKGEPLKQLAKIASGGEMSRVMLALKNVLAKADDIDTFIFDEIDTGVSGRTAQKVAEKLSSLSKERQILCITHLPQIASMADEHFLIEKKSDDFKTETNIFKLDNESSVKEIARLIGGVEITDHTLKAASEMISFAKETKH